MGNNKYTQSVKYMCYMCARVWLDEDPRHEKVSNVSVCVCERYDLKFER